MIRSLHIKNYTLIRSLEMNPSPGFNIITGETGAGKSIMLGAVGLLLGNRADSKVLLSEEEKCVIEGTFDISDYHLETLFHEADLEYEKECIIRREISPSGKSRAFINDSPVNLDVLKELGVRLMDIHSQHENLQLGSNLYQLQILDLFSGNEKLVADYQKEFLHYSAARKNYEELVHRASASAKELEFQQFQYNELEEADLRPGEQEELEKELELLENAEAIKLNLSQLIQLFDESEYAVISQVKQGLSLLASLRGFSERLGELYSRVDSVGIELQDISGEIGREQDKIEYDPERIQVVKDRLDLLFRLQQKHQVNSMDELIAIREKLATLLEDTVNLDDRIKEAKKRLDETHKKMTAVGKVLSDQRKLNSGVFSNTIQTLIHRLGIVNGVVDISVQEADPTVHGLDKVEMLFSANKGIKPREIKEVASGGEFSRLIFAIKYLIADKTALPTIIFDEIDTGVSGEIAIQMVDMMKKMALNHQVISISHLPQFAAGGDAHFYVYKDHSSVLSESKIRQLTQDERVTEIAKMISGENPTENALRNARELLKMSAVS